MARKKNAPVPGLFDELPEGNDSAAAPETDPFKLNADQEHALDLRTNRVISASAGTGKTHTLTALYLALLEGRLEPGHPLLKESEWLARAKAGTLRPLRPGEIVAATFTEKAAAELLERTREGLEHELGRDDFPETLQTHLKGCRKELFSAPVSTIHAFCARLLREAGAEGPAPAAFKVLNQEEAGELLDAALSSAAAEMLESGAHPSFRILAQEQGVFTRHAGLLECGRSLLHALRTRGLEPDALRARSALSIEKVAADFEDFYAVIATVPDSGKSKPKPELRDC